MDSLVPSVFQCLISDVLRDMLGKFVIAYIDDILIYASSLEAHVQHSTLSLVPSPHKSALHKRTEV